MRSIQARAIRAIGIANNNVVEQFDFEKLTSPHQIVGDFDVDFARYRVSLTLWHLTQCSILRAKFQSLTSIQTSNSLALIEAVSKFI